MQPTLPLSRSQQKSQRTDHVQRLLACLRRRGWVTRDLVARELGWSIRYLREVTEHADGAVLSGNKGLALVWEVPVAEAERSVRRLKNQADKMRARADATRRQMHSIRTEPAA